MILIPLSPEINQTLMVTIEEQDITLHVYQRGDRLYLDLSLADEPLRFGAICLPGLEIGGDMYPFTGTLFFVDENAEPNAQTPPQYTGLGTRFNLYYCTDTEILTALHEYFSGELVG